jgi:protein-S-isoprenylcysteine O-methyltransferase Ste14
VSDASLPSWLSRQPAVIAYGNFIFRYRNAVFPLVLAVLLILFPPRFFMGDEAMDTVLDVVAVIVGALGVGLRSAVVGLAYIKRGGLNKKVYADTLVVEGLFSHARNPLYLGNLLIVAGLLLLANSPGAYAVGVVYFLGSYFAIVATEERFLLDKFGESYRAYCARTPRWGFKFQGLGETFRNSRMDWRKVIAKEYSSIGVWILMNLAVFAYQEYVNKGEAESRGEIILSVEAMALTILAVWIVRIIKKRGGLESLSA